MVDELNELLTHFEEFKMLGPRQLNYQKIIILRYSSLS